jgi:nitric oxide dioxygenase
MGITRHPLFLDSGALPAVPVDLALMARLRNSFETVSDGTALADAFYFKLFAAHPQLRALFPTDMAAQKEKLLASLRTVVIEMHRPDVVGTALARLGKSHVGYGAKPEHYPVVCQMMLEALVEVGKIDADTRNDWRTALERVSAAMLRGAQSES